MFRTIRSVNKLSRIYHIYIKHKTPSVFQRRLLCSRKNVYLIDSEEFKENNVNQVNKYTERSFTCGELRMEHVNLRVTMFGWLEYQRMGKFFVLRDGYGHTQFIISEKDKKLVELLKEISFESILKVEGTVVARPKAQINQQNKTGEIEVVVSNLTLLNKAEKLPFNIRDFQKAKESLRMQYRYLDMRFMEMQRNFRVRSELCMAMREFLARHRGFVEVETPTLFKATPGGAQEFVVPTRFPNQFYSLVQSPQQFKQILMAGGIDRYFQIARCYRDESSRPDRQPEFTQMDIEMSFTDQNGIMMMTEELLHYSWPSFLKPLPREFPRYKFDDVMEMYGTDQPDTRYEYKITNCTDIINSNEVDFYAGCLIFNEPYSNITKSVRESLSLNQFPGTKLFLNKNQNKSEFISKIEKTFEKQIGEDLWNFLQLKENSLIFLVYGSKHNSLKRLGKLRQNYVNHLETSGKTIKKPGMNILWIINFPLFEKGEEEGEIASAHHPFTSPNLEDLHLLDTNPLQVRAQSYDLVLNGNEIAGGSIRIHDAVLQQRILDILKIPSEDLSHMLEMLSSGCPPHGGIAIGLDRLFSIILNTQSIRDVIAFPKTFEGRDPLSGAPTPLQEKDKVLYHLNVKLE